jgi:hypothetical protein
MRFVRPVLPWRMLYDIAVMNWTSWAGYHAASVLRKGSSVLNESAYFCAAEIDKQVLSPDLCTNPAAQGLSCLVFRRLG